jgi:superfamily II DNA/RNA helicase
MSVPFADLGVPSNLVERLAARGITEAFPIQEAAIPDALAGRDVVGKAITGSGKTLAFGLPLMARLTKARPRKPVALVLVPTRELAAQVQKELAQLSDDHGRRVISIYGGTSYNVARKALNFGVDVVVACPGRLEDMLEQGALDLSCTTTVVVDEADRMADMGFLPAVRRIIGTTSRERHVMLFSATMAPDIKSLIKEFTHDAVIHDVVGDEAPNDVDHFFWRVARDQRPEITADIVGEYERAIIFTRTKHGADRLARQLGERGISAVPLHGDRTQAQRDRALRSVKSGQVSVLVATDVAARGIHIELMPVVVHYDPPAQATDYLHRSGRTGRAGATGAVISLVGEDVVAQVRRLQRALGITAPLESPEDAVAIRLGAVDDVAASERLDDRGKGRVERPAREHVRGPRTFERREPRESASRPARNERIVAARSPRPSRSETRPRGERPLTGRAARPERTNDRQPSRFEDRGTTPRTPSKDKQAVVSFFNDSKGFGFASDDKGDDLFIHFSNIQGDGFKSLSQGQTITFEESTGPKGREARNVRVVGTGRQRR